MTNTLCKFCIMQQLSQIWQYACQMDTQACSQDEHSRVRGVPNVCRWRNVVT